ncbi:MAG: hypothetical protein JST54_23800 [Deltaproteobacteria bacterium]|nr:hypothetical protein [Deltaproteobacteria bacterium]
MRRVLLAMVALVAACSSVPPRVGEAPPHAPDNQKELQYHEVFDRYTRHAEIYDGFDTRMFMAATFETPEFVQVRSERMSSFLGLPAAEAQAVMARDLADASKGIDFFMGVSTAVRKVNDFGTANSIWRISLSTSTGEVTPILIDRISKPDDNLRGIYFYLGDFWVGYRMVFPSTLPNGQPVIPPGEKTVTFKLDSALGHAKLEFPAPGPKVTTPASSTASAR